MFKPGDLKTNFLRDLSRNVLSPIYWLLTWREVQMTGNWPSSLFCVSIFETESRSIDRRKKLIIIKKNEGNI